MRVGVIQLCTGQDMAENLKQALAYFGDAFAAGVDMIVTPEVSNIIAPFSSLRENLYSEEKDPMLCVFQECAAREHVWVLVGSLALLDPLENDTRFVNRSLLIAPDGHIKARYDKAHMFDVSIAADETYHESRRFRPGNRAIIGDVGSVKLGMQICYDMRFAYLSRQLAQAGAGVLTFPSAFSKITGKAHWEILLRARAIENGCFVVAPAQTGRHHQKRQSYGHSLVVNPWGEVILDAGVETGFYMVDLGLNEVADARQRIPSLKHDRKISFIDE